MASSTTAAPAEESTSRATSPALLAFAALGVVYGDIGTSPLYAIKESFHPGHGLHPTPESAIGILSLFVWTLILVVVIKYIFVVMRADNNGEGGILSLLALASPKLAKSPIAGRNSLIAYLGLLGASLLAAEGTITPAISVLSAIEGLEVATPVLKPAIIPITIVILFFVFRAQAKGTAKVASVFAPAMLVWFFTIAIIAIPHILRRPEVLAAFNPLHAVGFFLHNGSAGFWVLGAVVLCITGAEALYADMGHFGRTPIRRAWFALVFPSLVINYLGQGALILERGEAVLENPFYALAPDWFLYPLVAISTMAAVIASQALISGSFSLAQQAVQLGYSPRLSIVHTSEEHRGQIYVPEINTLLMVCCILLVLTFKSSSALAAAYGISVMGTMNITSILVFTVAYRNWRWPLWKAGGMLLVFLTIDVPFLVANLPKFFEGGWFPMAVGAVVLTGMVTWKRGRQSLMRRVGEKLVPVPKFVENIKNDSPYRIRGTAVFMTGNVRMTPPALSHHYRMTNVLHEQIIILSIVTSEVPRVPLREIVEVRQVGQGIFEMIAHFGYMQSPKIDKILRLLRIQHHVHVVENEVTYFLGRDILLTAGPSKMARWRKTLFAFLSRNSVSATSYFGIPPDRVIEIGMQVSL
jgi:KUP system potassium uptake protein